MNVYDNIVRILGDSGAYSDTIDHAPVTGCEDSLAFRTEAGWSGASSKCILFHAKGLFYLVVTTADRVIKARNFKKPFGTKNIRFASPEEVADVTGCSIGSMPPFGFADTRLPIFVDKKIFDHAEFMFNPAVPDKSFKITTHDLAGIYARLPNPVKWFADNEDGKFDFSDLA